MIFDKYPFQRSSLIFTKPSISVRVTFKPAISAIIRYLSVAAIIYAIQDLETTGGRGLDEMPLDDFFTYLPYVWIGSLALFVASAILSVRQTRRGYRYPVSYLVTAALALSLALGVALHFADAGSAVHDFLSRNIALYDRLTRFSETRHNAPAEGFLAGRILLGDAKILVVTDFDGATWTVDITGAELKKNNLVTDEDIAVEGEATGPGAFKARLVRDWD